MNPFFSLQERVADLLRASTYFTGVTVLTEKIGDIEGAIEQAIVGLGFGVSITTARGTARESDRQILVLDETLTIAVIHNPTLDPAHAALDAILAAIQAVHGQPVNPDAAPPARTRDILLVTRHEAIMAEEAAGLHVHHLTVSAPLRGLL